MSDRNWRGQLLEISPVSHDAQQARESGGSTQWAECMDPELCGERLQRLALMQERVSGPPNAHSLLDRQAFRSV